MSEGSLVHKSNDVYRLHLPLVLVKGLADRDTGSNNNGAFQAYTQWGGVCVFVCVCVCGGGGGGIL